MISERRKGNQPENEWLFSKQEGENPGKERGKEGAGKAAGGVGDPVEKFRRASGNPVLVDLVDGPDRGGENEADQERSLQAFSGFTPPQCAQQPDNAVEAQMNELVDERDLDVHSRVRYGSQQEGQRHP